MKLTNETGLPDAIVQAVSKTQYAPSRSRDSIGVTALIDSPRVRILKRDNWEAMTEDASDKLWALLGILMHEALEKSETVAKVEGLLSMQVLGWTLRGKFDRALLDVTGLLQDYKLMSVWERIYGIKKDKEAQLNVYAELLSQNGREVKALEVVAIYRDWSKGQATREQGGNYPAKQAERIPVALWPQSQRLAYIEERVRLHQAAETALPLCTPEERWASPDTYAVMKEGNKRAARVLDSMEEAKHWEYTNLVGSKSHIEVRPGDQTKRCRDYCSVKDFCVFYQEYAKNNP